MIRKHARITVRDARTCCAISAAGEMVDAGTAIDVVQAVLGHRSITSTQIYAWPGQDRMRDAVQAVEAVSRQRRSSRGREGS